MSVNKVSTICPHCNQPLELALVGDFHIEVSPASPQPPAGVVTLPPLPPGATPADALNAIAALIDTPRSIAQSFATVPLPAPSAFKCGNAGCSLFGKPTCAAPDGTAPRCVKCGELTQPIQ